MFSSALIIRTPAGLVSFEVPRFAGAQKIKVTRGGVVLANVVGSELVNASSDPAVLARCDHQTFTGAASLLLAAPATTTTT